MIIEIFPQKCPQSVYKKKSFYKTFFTKKKAVTLGINICQWKFRLLRIYLNICIIKSCSKGSHFNNNFTQKRLNCINIDNKIVQSFFKRKIIHKHVKLCF